MTHRGGLSLSIIIWRIGWGGGQVSFCPGAQNTLGSPDYTYKLDYINSLTLLSKKNTTQQE